MAESSKTRLGKYELLLPPVGEGSEGFLYKACCVEDSAPGAALGEFVALKRLRHIGREMRPDRFQRQAELLRKLNHPGIVSYKDSFVWRDEEADEAPEVYCLVTEWLEGRSLKALIEQHPGGVPWEIAEGTLRQVLEALAYASTQRVIHRDLKPSNIYLLNEGQVKLIDFGIARPMDAEATTTSTTSNFEGTWNWMAPDFVRLQEDSFRGDERSDIYSFGVCFFQVLTGKYPYGSPGENPQFSYFQRWLAPNPPKVAANPNLNVLKGARSCIQKCLEVDRDKRFQNFEELLDAFGKIRYRQLRHAPEVYEYRRYLGQGGFGQVYRGRRLSDGREIAVKELVAGQHARRFVREAKILQKAPHPHLVEYLDFVEVQASHVGDDPRYFLVLEYLEGMPGSSLRERIKGSGKELDPRELLVLFQGYLDCLEHLHQHEDHIIHRDIKPGNLYAPAGAPQNGKLFDLGIAHDEEGTRTHGQVPGTLDYMPPEFAGTDSGRGSPQSDIYSLAVTLYEALTNSLPFPRLPSGEKAWVEYIARSLKPQECSFDHRVFGQYTELADLLRPALAQDPRQRYPSAKTMKDEIQKVLDSWSRKEEAVEAVMAAARAAFERDDWEETERQVKQAFEVVPLYLPAEQLLAKSQARRQELCDAALAQAQAAREAGDFTEAQQHAERALGIQPANAAAKQLLSQLVQSRQDRYESATALAQAAWEGKNYSEVQRQAAEALKVKPDDETAAHLLVMGRDAEQRAKVAARQQAGVLSIQLPQETWDHPPQFLEADEPFTAPTAPTTDLPEVRKPTSELTTDHGNGSRVELPGELIRDSQSEARGLRGLRPKRWLASIAGVAVVIGIGIAVRVHLPPTPVNPNPGGDPGVHPRRDYGIGDVRNRLPELLTNAVVQSEPVVLQALKALAKVESPTDRDLAPLQAILIEWWTNAPGTTSDLVSLPLGDPLQRRVRQERLNDAFPSLPVALENLERTIRNRQSTSTNLSSLLVGWGDVGRKIASSPDAGLWRGLSPSSNLFRGLVERDFSRQLAEHLGGRDAAWTPAQYVQMFNTTKEQVLGELAQHGYRPPEKLGWLAKFKDDAKNTQELRNSASEALNLELQTAQNIAQGSGQDSFSGWKAKLETYRPVPSSAQISELPPLGDFGLVEGYLNEVTTSINRSGMSSKDAEAARSRLQALGKALALLRTQYETLQRSIAAGLVSQERRAELGNKLGASLHGLQDQLSKLETETKENSVRAAENAH